MIAKCCWQLPRAHTDQCKRLSFHYQHITHPQQLVCDLSMEYMLCVYLLPHTQLLQQPGPYPLVVSPPDGGYKVMNGEYASSLGSDGRWQAPEISTEHFRVDVDNIALLYGRHFVGKVSIDYWRMPITDLLSLFCHLTPDEGFKLYPKPYYLQSILPS